MNKSTKVCVVIIIMLLATMGFGGYYGFNYAYDLGRDAGYDVGYDEGYTEGHDEGYTEGYDDAEWELGENDLSGNLGPAPDTITFTSDTAPAGMVFVTPAGEKYHEAWCRYIDGRHDLTHYLSAADAINAGYDACSVCH